MELIGVKQAGFWFNNLSAGFTVSLVALPLAIGFGESSSLGATSGLITAILAGLIAAIFGGSKYQVSGPTGAMTAVLIPIVMSLGFRGVMAAGFLAGCLLVLASVFKLGSHIHKLPTSLIEGFGAGIALVIARQQFAWTFANYLTAFFAIVTGVLVWFGINKFPKLPVSVLIISLMTAIAAIFKIDLPKIPSIKNPFAGFGFDFFREFSNPGSLIVPALGIALLAAFESLLSAKIADNLAAKGDVHNSDKELLGQGLANIFVPFFGGMPATAALARTAVNVRAGATSRFSAAMHSIFLVVIVLGIGPLVRLIPLSVLAGVLLVTAINMLKPKQLYKVATRTKLDLILVSSTIVLTVFTDLSTALIAGTLVWLALRKTKLATSEKLLDV